MENYVLNNNIKIPNIGLGTYKINDDETMTNVISSAYKYGYRLIDTASSYGNEKVLGNAIKTLKINRADIFITSKLANTDKGYESTLEAFNQTLKNLQTDYLDLYLIHWPMTNENWRELNFGTWKAFEELYNQKKIRAIGVSNFLVNHLEDFLENVEIPPMVNQIELHPGLLRRDTLDFCKEHRIQVQAWSPLGYGRLIENDQIMQIAKKYNKSVAQVCLKWCLQNGAIPITKTTHSERLKENIDIFDFVLDDTDMDKLSNMKNSYEHEGILDPNIILKCE